MQGRGPDRSLAWKPVRTADGSWTLAHPVHGETCHSLAGAWQEARERYAEPCRLRARARERGTLRLLDVGTGLGLNLAAALEALAGTGARLAIVSLECSADVIRAALALQRGPEGQERWHPFVRGALERALAAREDGAQASSSEIVAGDVHAALRLVLGDARSTLPALEREERFDAVFLDPFSPRVEPDLWAPAFLAEVARRVARGGLLSTYSSAFRVRAALAAAGLEVGAGPRVGTKSSGTLAGRDAAVPPLDPRTARRLARALGAPARPPAEEQEQGIPDGRGV